MPAPYSRFLCALLVSVQLASLSSALKGDSACRNSVCVAATVQDDVATYELTANLDPVGWVAVGFGPHMTNTHMVVMWKNDDGTTTLSQRYASEYREPRPEAHPPRIATVAAPNPSFQHPAGSSTLAFQVPINRTLLTSASPVEDLIYAYSSHKPEKDPNATLLRHTHVGHFQLDLTKDFVAAALPSPSPKPTHAPAAAPAPGSHATVYRGSNMAYKRVEKLIILHAFLVSLGFLVILPAGALVGRWGRSFTPRWFRAHYLSNFALAAPVITLGVLLGPAVVYNKDNFRIHFANPHEVYGIVLLFLYYAQALLGRYIHNRRLALAAQGPVTRNHPPLNIVHIGLGVSIIALAFFQVRSGMEWWETLTGRGPITSWALPLWNAWIVVLPLAYFGGYALLPRQLRQEKAAYVPISEDSVEEGQSQTTRLLAEEGRS